MERAKGEKGFEEGRVERWDKLRFVKGEGYCCREEGVISANARDEE